MFTGWFNKENIYTLPTENPRRRNIRVVYDKWITHHQVKWCCAPPTLQIWNLFAAALRICRYRNVFISIRDIHSKCKNLVWATPSGVCTNVESIRNWMFVRIFFCFLLKFLGLRFSWRNCIYILSKMLHFFYKIYVLFILPFETISVLTYLLSRVATRWQNNTVCLLVVKGFKEFLSSC